MNKANEEFLEKNDINLEELEKRGLSSNLAREELNEVFDNYGFQKNVGMKEISIADLVGFSKYQIDGARTIIDGFKWCFDESGGDYARRGLGMLKIDRDNIVEALEDSFTKEPISVIETEGNKYNILSNGMHRFIVLRLLYLSELVKAGDDPQKIEELRQKYTVPMDVTEIEKEKTYSKFLIMIANKFENNPEKRIYSIRDEYSNHKKTGRVEVIYGKKDKEIVSEDELLERAKKETIEKKLFAKENMGMAWDVISAYKKYPSFQQFIHENFHDIDLENDNKNKNEERDEI